MKKIALFVDVQNIYYTVKEAFGCNFDYNRFWDFATTNRELIAANAYAIDRGDEKQKQFQNILRGIGFEVKLKPFIQRSDGSAKGDWDVGITIDVMEWAPKADIILLATGDGDFAMLAQRVREKFGVTVEVYGVKQLTADALIQSASTFIPIEGDLLLR